MGENLLYSVQMKYSSPNFTKGRKGQKPIGVCLHIGEGSLNSITSWFKDPNSGVSAHYGIGKNGEVRQFVLEENTAWHSGIRNKPTWRYTPGSNVNTNSVLIGIEHEGYYRDVWTEKMKKASAQLVYEICTRWGIPINRDFIIGHYQIDNVRRKNCPAANKGIIDEIVELAIKIAVKNS